MADEQGTISSPITVNGQTLTRDQVVQLAADEKAATDKAAGEKAKGGAEAATTGAAGAAGTDGAAAGAEKPKPGVLYRDGKPVGDGEYLPRQRYNEEIGRYRDRVKAAGFDPDTMQPLPKEGAGAAGAAGGDGKPAEFKPGTEPWARDLLPEPKEDDKDAQGNDKYPDTKSFIKALADTQAHNKWVELTGRQKLADQQAQEQRNKSVAAENDAKLLHTFQSEVVPAALAKHELTMEQFNGKLEALKGIPPNEQRDTFVWNFALRDSANGGDLLIALADEAQTPEGLAYLTKLGTLDSNKLLVELARIDGRVQAGLTVQGKPKAAGAAGGAAGGKGGDGGGLPNGGKGGNGQGSQDLSASPTVGVGGAATDPKALTGDAHFAHLEAQEKAKRDERLKRLQTKA